MSDEEKKDESGGSWRGILVSVLIAAGGALLKELAEKGKK